MNQLNDKLLELIMFLDEVQSDSLDHHNRKKLLLEIHQLKVEARKEQVDTVTNELMALEHSLGFGSDELAFNLSDVQEHRQRLAHLAGVGESEYETEHDTEQQTDNETESVVEPEIDFEVEYSSETEPGSHEEDNENIETSEQQHLADKGEEEDKEIEQFDLLPSSIAEIHLTLCNCKSRDEARELAHGLVENRLAACVNFVANIGAIYRWQDSIEDTSECQLQIKSIPERDQDIKDYIKAHHSYDVPEIITVPIQQANQEYVQWVRQETSK